MGQEHGFLSREIRAGIEDFLKGDLRLSESMKFKQKKNENAVIVTTNIYLKEKSELQEFFLHISAAVESIIKKHLAFNGEIIKLSAEGNG